MAFAILKRAKILNVLETLAIGTAGGALFLFVGLPGGLISGAMVAVGIAATAGRPLAVPPILTQTLLVLLGISLGSFAIAIAVSAIFVAVIALTTQVRLADIMVAYAPGAMDAMLALALTLHIDPIFVGAHHLSRFVFVTITTPGIIHSFGRPQEDVDD